MSGEWETPCPKREDGQHCDCWYDGAACCGCGDNDHQLETEVETSLTFSTALALLKDGKHVQRLGWNGKGQYVAMQTPDEHSKMRLPYAYLVNVAGDTVPWVPSQGDLFAEDWQTR